MPIPNPTPKRRETKAMKTDSNKIEKIAYVFLIALFLFFAILAHPAISANITRYAENGNTLHEYLTYASLAFVGCAVLVGLVFRFGALWLKLLATLAITLVLVEIGLAAGILFLSKVPHTGTLAQQRLFGAFEFHSSLGAVPKPNYHYKDCCIEIRHNALGMRGDEFDMKQAKKRPRLITVGGSTTYDVGVSDSETWPQRLQELFGDDAEVLNFGIPGHASPQHVILTSLILSDFKPDTLVFFMGWNDIRQSHVPSLRPDYSDFHVPSLYSDLGIDTPYGRFATVTALSLLREFMPNTLYYFSKRTRGIGPENREIDQRLLGYYGRNVRLLAGIGQMLGAKVVFVPQVFNPEAFKSSQASRGWIRNIPEDAVRPAMAAFNATMVSNAREGKATVIDTVLSHGWVAKDFLDDGHFSAQGAQTFARLVFQDLRDGGLVGGKSR